MFPFNYINKGLISLGSYNDFVKNVNDVVEKQYNIEKEFFTVE
jgi:hypothetical protein